MHWKNSLESTVWCVRVYVFQLKKHGLWVSLKDWWSWETALKKMDTNKISSHPNNPSQEAANKNWFLQLLSIRVCASTTAWVLLLVLRQLSVLGQLWVAADFHSACLYCIKPPLTILEECCVSPSISLYVFSNISEAALLHQQPFYQGTRK